MAVFAKPTDDECERLAKIPDREVEETSAEADAEARRAEGVLPRDVVEKIETWIDLKIRRASLPASAYPGVALSRKLAEFDKLIADAKAAITREV